MFKCLLFKIYDPIFTLKYCSIQSHNFRFFCFFYHTHFFSFFTIYTFSTSFLCIVMIYYYKIILVCYNLLFSVFLTVPDLIMFRSICSTYSKVADNKFPCLIFIVVVFIVVLISLINQCID